LKRPGENLDDEKRQGRLLSNKYEELTQRVSELEAALRGKEESLREKQWLSKSFENSLAGLSANNEETVRSLKEASSFASRLSKENDAFKAG